MSDVEILTAILDVAGIRHRESERGRYVDVNIIEATDHTPISFLSADGSLWCVPWAMGDLWADDWSCRA